MESYSVKNCSSRKDMPEAEILSKRTMREGSVEVGTPTVVESPNPPADAPKRSEKK